MLYTTPKIWFNVLHNILHNTYQQLTSQEQLGIWTIPARQRGSLVVSLAAT